MQYPLGIPPNLRTNIDYVFILREPYIANRKRIWENYAGMFPTFESFCQVMDQCTENFECLVINNNAKSNKLHEQIFWYKAQQHGPFKLGSKEFWEISKDLHSDDEEESYDPKNSGKKGPKINVKKSKWWKVQNLHVESRFACCAKALHIWVKQDFHFEQVIMILLLRSAEQDFINPVFKI